MAVVSEKYPIPANESERLAALRAYGVLDTPTEGSFDKITSLASFLFQAPIALISLVDSHRQWFKSRIGIEMKELPRAQAFCAHTIMGSDSLTVLNALNDARFAHNPLVVGSPGIRFYAGVPLVTREGYPLGSLCVIDTQPRMSVTATQMKGLTALGMEAMAQMTLRYSSSLLSETLLVRQRESTEELLKCCLYSAVEEAASLTEICTEILNRLCRAAHWSVGIAWAPSPRTRCGRENVGWIASPVGTFEQIRKTIVDSPSECPHAWVEGVWRHGKTERLDLTLPSPSFRILRDEGLVAAAIFPIQKYGEVLAVFEFFSNKRMLDEDVRMVEEVLDRIGEGFLRRRREDERKQQERELRRSNRVKDQFLATLAHELRNPLAPILNAVELLRYSDPGDALDVIERQARHLARLVEDLLDLSRVNQGKMTLIKVRTDLVEVARAVVRDSESLLRPRLFTAEYPSSPVWVDADPVRLEQIISNLLRNAVKYSRDGDAIRLTVSKEGERCLLRVEDEGEGIAPEAQARIFEPFVQIRRAGDASKGGLGVGLSLVRQLVELHDGAVTVKSEGEGTGSCFTVDLPLSTMHDAPNSGLPSNGAVEGGRGKRVMIVDDNLDLLGTLKRLIGRWGYTVEVFPNGEAAQREAVRFDPSVAIIDLGLPEMDGCALAKSLRAIPSLSGTRFIAMSGYGQTTDEARAEEAGFERYLLKPVDPTALKALLMSLTH